ncbi:SGNH/GDSL hydrolase family protein [Patescibacteria group bacterium]|nr:SGNH/GDSL hydrolase family protein [Patescibacteria group bacterium]
MLLFFFFLFIFFFFSPSPVKAQIPLFFQLQIAYQPRRINPSPLFSPQVLGLSTTSPAPTPTPPSPLLQNIGGEGRVITIALLGDSMIDTIPSDILEKSLNLYYPYYKFNVLNYGRGASNIEQGLSLLPSLLSQKPDLIAVESFAYNNFGNNQSGIDRQWLTLGAITTEIKKNLPDTPIVLTATIAPNSIIFGNGSPYTFTSLEKIEKTSTIKLYLKNIINFATSQNFPLADAFTPSLKNDQGDPQFINSNDNIHPSDQGAQFFCDTLASTIFQNKLIQ